MKNETQIRLHRIYAIILSISLLLAGLCLIAGCLSIYYSGEQPFSRESVADAFSGIAVPVYLCIALTAVGFVLELISPSRAEKQKAAPIAYMTRERLLAKKDMSGKGDVLNNIYRERRLRRLHCLIRAVLMSAGGAVFLIYALDADNFGSDINASVIRAMWVLIPCLALPFVYSVFAAFLTEKSLKREIELIRQLPAAEDTEKSAPSRKHVNTVRAVIIAVGIALLLYGLFSGGTADVLTKARNICTECIGLG